MICFSELVLNLITIGIHEHFPQLIKEFDNECMDARGRAMHGAIADDEGLLGLDWLWLLRHSTSHIHVVE